MKKIGLSEVERILEQASDSIADYAVEQHKYKFVQIDNQIQNLNKMKTNISTTMKELRTNWKTLEDDVEKIINIDDKICEIKENIRTKEINKPEYTDCSELQEQLKQANIERNNVISNYFKNLGSIGEKAEADYKKQLESGSEIKKKFAPLHNIILQTMDQSRVEVKEKIYNLKRKKIDEMISIRDTNPYLDAFIKEWKKTIENGKFPQSTKKLVLNDNQPEPFKNSMYFSLNFLKDALGYDTEKLTPQFIENEINNKAYELRALVEDVNNNKKLSRKLKEVIVEGDLVFSKAFTFKRDKVKDFGAEVKKTLEKPQMNPPQITKDRVDSKILKQYCKVDLLKESLKALSETNKLLQREKTFERSPGFNMYG